MLKLNKQVLQNNIFLYNLKKFEFFLIIPHIVFFLYKSAFMYKYGASITINKIKHNIYIKN